MNTKKFNVVVKKRFLDRYTGTYRKPGEKMTISEARLREIRRSGDYVEVEPATTTAGSEPKKTINEIKK